MSSETLQGAGYGALAVVFVLAFFCVGVECGADLGREGCADPPTEPLYVYCLIDGDRTWCNYPDGRRYECATDGGVATCEREGE